jgi:hypothetical protein
VAERRWTIRRGIHIRLVVDGPDVQPGERVEVVEASLLELTAAARDRYFAAFDAEREKARGVEDLCDSSTTGMVSVTPLRSVLAQVPGETPDV